VDLGLVAEVVRIDVDALVAGRGGTRAHGSPSLAHPSPSFAKAQGVADVRRGDAEFVGGSSYRQPLPVDQVADHVQVDVVGLAAGKAEPVDAVEWRAPGEGFVDAGGSEFGEGVAVQGIA
jgi:hypothetical protein